MCFPKLRKFANLKCSYILNLSAFDNCSHEQVRFQCHVLQVFYFPVHYFVLSLRPEVKKRLNEGLANLLETSWPDFFFFTLYVPVAKLIQSRLFCCIFQLQMCPTIFQY